MFLKPIDFVSMYKEHKSITDFKGKTQSDWDKKSKSMALNAIKSPYVDEFISKMELEKNDTILDIGCGPGTLTIPLAKQVKHVIAVDYSEKMLDELHEYAKKENITNITTYHLSWEDSWDIIEDVDIVIASRSMEVDDIDDALKKLSDKAKKACYVTYKVGGSFVDLSILDYIGKKITLKPDFWYIPMILYQRGYLPKIDYIETKPNISSKNRDDFIASLKWSLGSLSEDEEIKAKEYYDKYILTQNLHPKPFSWAFISWKIS